MNYVKINNLETDHLTFVYLGVIQKVCLSDVIIEKKKERVHGCDKQICILSEWFLYG